MEQEFFKPGIHLDITFWVKKRLLNDFAFEKNGIAD
jgi:hypothetical protein